MLAHELSHHGLENGHRGWRSEMAGHLVASPSLEQLNMVSLGFLGFGVCVCVCVFCGF